MALLRQFPGFVVLLLAFAGLMLVPAFHAAHLRNWPVARVFLDHALFLGLLGLILGYATMNRVPRRPTLYHLLTILLTFLLIPLALALPVQALVPGLGFGRAYFEMLSCLTTTGATLLDRVRLLPEPLHLWRALVGWMGGLIVLISAFAVLAPLNLGGFELLQAGSSHLEARRGTTLPETCRRAIGFTRTIAPLYALLTGGLALVLILAGDRPFIALCHAMGTLSTSGISPVGGLAGGRSGPVGEVAIALMLLTAVSPRILGFGSGGLRLPSLADPQVQLMLITVLGVTLVLFLRSFLGAAGIDRQDNILAALRALWGGLFTSLSFLTTTGYESRDWRTMQLWSDLPAPGTILMGMAVMGGGIATSAGGVKLLRLFALYRHGLREMDLLIHPSAVLGRGPGDRLLSTDAARIAFIFLLLFLIGIALVMIALAATGLDFQSSLAAAISGLTTTGPLLQMLGNGLHYADLTGPALTILGAAMIVGRMEVLVIVALFNPALWRR